jgi:tellurite resistance protein TerC
MQIYQNLFLLFTIVVGGFLIADLFYFNRKAHVIKPKSALIQTGFWVSVALCFAFLILLFLGRTEAIEFVSIYITEEMLSVDNLFVILLIFNFFKIEEEYHHKVLFWGILGAILFRALFITGGSILVHQFAWILYIFGGLLIFTGIKLFTDKGEEHIDLEKNKTFRFLHTYLPVSSKHHNGKFFLKEKGKTYVTSLFIILCLIEVTDILFAIDSIPAAFSISQNAFIIFTANILAVMGLRSLFFLIENLLNTFHHLQKALSFILIFIGAKMFLGIVEIHISSLISFGFIILALLSAVILSLLFPKKM